ncbi:MAG: TetR family transcriptional regulator [Myxococcota bacterium]
MPRRSDRPLDRDLIAACALALFREGGLAAVTTRRVASALGVSPMALYVHVGNKEGLLDAVVERLMRAIKIDLDSEASWPAQAEQWAHALRAELSAHPGAMDLLRTRRWALVRCTEPLIRALLAAGFSEERAIRAARLVTWVTMGFLSVESGVDLLGSDDRQADRLERSLDRLEVLEGRAATSPASRGRGVDRADIDALVSLELRLIVRGPRPGSTSSHD